MDEPERKQRIHGGERKQQMKSDGGVDDVISAHSLLSAQSKVKREESLSKINLRKRRRPNGEQHGVQTKRGSLRKCSR